MGSAKTMTPAARAEMNVKTTHKMYEIRDVYRRLCGADYAARIIEAQVLIRRAPCEPIRFLPWLVGKLAEDGETIDPRDVMRFTAAIVELIEAES